MSIKIAILVKDGAIKTVKGDEEVLSTVPGQVACVGSNSQVEVFKKGFEAAKGFFHVGQVVQ